MKPAQQNTGNKVAADSAARLEEEGRLRLIVFRAIVQLSDTVTEEFLLQKLNYLDVNSWMEIAEERYLGRLCGYPCCSNSVQIVKHQKYRIDRKNKKIFERSTERDKFCSEHCLMSFNRIRCQLDEEPLWLRGLQKQKKFDLNLPVKDTFVKPQRTSFEYVEERIEKQLNTLVVGDSNDTDDEKDKDSDENIKSTEDDELFISELSNFLSQKASISGNKCKKDKQIPRTSSNISKPHDTENPTVKQVACLKKPALSEEEKIAKLRSKFAAARRGQRRGPPIVEAKSLDVLSKSKADDFDKEILNDLIKKYFGPKTLDYLRSCSGDWVEEVSECERILQQFYAGDKAYERRDDDVFIPKVDDLDQDLLRRDVFSSFSKLESQLKTRGLYDRAQPLISTLSLNASNVDLKKTDAQLLVALLFSMLAHCENSLQEQFFTDGVPCDMFKEYLESIGCDFDVFQSVVASYLHEL